MSITSLPPLGAGEIAGPMIGLFLIALGTGGIKPCVSAFGGDQFTSDQSHLLQSFFSVFYFAINAGSLLSMLITPVLRGRDAKKSCYCSVSAQLTFNTINSIHFLIWLWVFIQMKQLVDTGKAVQLLATKST